MVLRHRLLKEGFQSLSLLDSRFFLVIVQDVLQVVLIVRLVRDLDNGEAVTVSSCLHLRSRILLLQISGVGIETDTNSFIEMVLFLHEGLGRGGILQFSHELLEVSLVLILIRPIANLVFLIIEPLL